MLVVKRELPITHYPLPITHYPLPITHYLLPITHLIRVNSHQRLTIFYWFAILN
ncbi:MAG: alpha/beta hydrolase [Dolichospermum sp.]